MKSSASERKSESGLCGDINTAVAQIRFIHEKMQYTCNEFITTSMCEGLTFQQQKGMSSDRTIKHYSPGLSFRQILSVISNNDKVPENFNVYMITCFLLFIRDDITCVQLPWRFLFQRFPKVRGASSLAFLHRQVLR